MGNYPFKALENANALVSKFISYMIALMQKQSLM